MIILLHGYASSAKRSNTVKNLKNYISKDYNGAILTPSYNYNDADKTAEYLLNFVNDAIKEHDDNELIFIGTSLGGFWARYLANQFYGSVLIMLNPALEAPKILTDIAESYLVSLDAFKKYYIEKDKDDIRISSYVAKDDDVVPVDATERLIGKERCKLLYTDDGGHRMTTIEKILPEINKDVFQV